MTIGVGRSTRARTPRRHRHDPGPTTTGPTAVRIAVLAGGRSSEHDVSLALGRLGARRAGRGRPRRPWVELGRDGSWRARARRWRCTPARGLLGADAVFPVLHGPFGEDGTVQGLLELLDVAYVGSGVLASALCMDKVVFKDADGASAGLPQVAYWLARRRGGRGAGRSSALGLPVLGQARAAGLVGRHRARRRRRRARRPRSEAAAAHDARVIVEAIAPRHRGRVLGARPHRRAAGQRAGRDRPARRRGGWYDYEAKYTPGGMELVVPARISDAARERVRELAVAAFRLAGCSGLARADFFVDGEEVLLNELNTMPGFTQTSVYGKLWDPAGCPTPSSATAWCASPSSASSAGGLTGTEAAARPRCACGSACAYSLTEGKEPSAAPGRAARALACWIGVTVRPLSSILSGRLSHHGGRPPAQAPPLHSLSPR